MNIISCFELSLAEIKNSRKIFAFYILIFVCMISVSVSMLRIAMLLPESITDLVREMRADTIVVYCQSPEDIESLFSSREADIYSCSSFSLTGDLLFGEAYNKERRLLIKSGNIAVSDPKLRYMDIEYIKENIVFGDFETENDRDCVWISEYLSQKLGVKCSQKLVCSDKNGEEITVTVKGIYKEDDMIGHFCVREELMKKLVPEYCQEFELDIRCSVFSDFNKIIEKLNENNIFHNEDTTVYNVLNMMYSAFYISSLILIVSLTGIILYLLEQYYTRRMRFFEVGSVLGMTEKDLLTILFFIAETVLTVSVLISGIFSFLIENRIAAYAQELFGYDFGISGFPFFQMLIVFVMIQICIAADILMIRRLC